MKNDVGSEFAIDRPKFDDEAEVTNRIGATAVHADVMMHTTSFNQAVGVLVDGRNRVNLMSFRKEGFNEVHPEIVNIPGRVQDYCNFH
jgi:hypothetical protein